VTKTDMIRYTARTIPHQPLLIAVALSTILAGASHGRPTVFPLQAGSILLAAGAGFALDDPAFALLAASPTSMLKRRLSRLLIILPPITVTWAGLVMLHQASASDEVWTLLAMFAGLLGLGLGIAGISCRLMAGRGGAVTAPAMLAAIVVSSVIPPRWRPLPLGDVPGGWTALQTRWTTAAALGTIVFLASSRDLAKGRPRPNKPSPITPIPTSRRDGNATR
jgi:hypothetical protein